VSRKSKKKPSSKQQTPTPKKPPSKAMRLLKELIVLIAVIAGMVYMTQSRNYGWLFRSIVLGNLKMIRAYPHLTYDEKMESKLGVGYKLVQYVKTHTPEDAVILAPYDKDLARVGLNYYLYPRFIIPQRSARKSPMYLKATHLIIFKGKGYDYLQHPPSDRAEYDLIAVAPGDLAVEE